MASQYIMITFNSLCELKLIKKIDEIIDRKDWHNEVELKNKCVYKIEIS